jgi:transcription termination factor Rho
MPTDLPIHKEHHMPVLSRDALEASPLADLHAIASELGVDGFRRLRKADLINTIVVHQGGEAVEAEADTDADTDADAAEARPRRSRRGGRGRSRTRDAEEGEGEGEGGSEVAEAEAEAEAEAADVTDAVEAPRPRRARRPRRDEEPVAEEREERVVEGVVELLGNGSGFVRVAPPEHSDDDIYISAAQIRRCELVSGDRVSGPVRRPRRSERYPSLVRVDTINGASADEVAEVTPFAELPAAFPTQALDLGGDPALEAVARLAPIGRGSRVTIAGAPRSGKTELLRRLAAALSGQDGLELSLVLIGVRPEELHEAKEGPVEPAGALSFAAGNEAQSQALERAIDTAKRLAARGGDAVLLVDTLDGVHPPSARKALAAARNIVDGGSLTVIATASRPLGGETTVVALDATRAATGAFPALDPVASGTLRPEALVGDDGAKAILEARAQALAS